MLRHPSRAKKMGNRMTHEKPAMPEQYPEKIWVYNRSGKLEARDSSIVVGNVSYTKTAAIAERLGNMKRKTPSLTDQQHYEDRGWNAAIHTILDTMIKEAETR